MGKLMSRFTITNRQGEETVEALPLNAFYISEIGANRCNDPLTYVQPTVLVYHDGNLNASLQLASTPPSLGDFIYSDEALTTLYNNTTTKDYNIKNNAFITISDNGKLINSNCT